MRKNIRSGSPYEEQIGFCRAVRMGPIIAVSGTGPIDPKTKGCPESVYDQAKLCIRIMLNAIDEAGGSVKNVIRTRMYLTNANDWEEVAKAHNEIFSDINPAATMVEVSRFIDKRWKIEMECDCYID